MSTEEAYRILNLNPSKNLTKEDVNKAYIKIQKKIHPDISPETSRLSTLVNEAKEKFHPGLISFLKFHETPSWMHFSISYIGVSAIKYQRLER